MFVLVWFISRGWNFFVAHTSQQQTVKRSDETHEFCKISYPISALFILTDHDRPMRELLWSYQVSGAHNPFPASV